MPATIYRNVEVLTQIPLKSLKMGSSTLKALKSFSQKKKIKFCKKKNKEKKIIFTKIRVSKKALPVITKF